MEKTWDEAVELCEDELNINMATIKNSKDHDNLVEIMQFHGKLLNCFSKHLIKSKFNF